MALHIYEKHPDYFNDKLDNFSLSIIKSTRPHDLERAEDYYIWLTRGDTLGLNRSKPVQYFTVFIHTSLVNWVTSLPGMFLVPVYIILS